MNFFNEFKEFNGKLWAALILFVLSCVIDWLGMPVLSYIGIGMGLAAFGLFIWDFIILKTIGNPPKFYTIVIYPWYVWNKNKLNEDKVGSKDKTLVKLFVGAMVLWLITIFMAGGSSANNMLLKEAVMQKYRTTVTIQMPWITVGNLAVTNEYIKMIKDEKVHVYDVVVDMAPDKDSAAWKDLVQTTYKELGCVGGVNPTSCDDEVQEKLKEYIDFYCGKGAKVTVGLVKRGNSWYVVN